MRALLLLSLYVISASAADAQIMVAVLGDNSSSGGSLSGSYSSTPTTVNLTTTGTTDWAQWGSISSACPGMQQKSQNGTSGGPPAVGDISAYSTTGSPSVAQYSSFGVSFSWTDGVTNTSESGISNGCYSSNTTSAFVFTAPATTATHTLIVYTSLDGGVNWTFNAHLGDSSAPDYNSGGTSAGGNNYTVFTLVYKAGTATTITITVGQTASGAGTNFSLLGAAYQ